MLAAHVVSDDALHDRRVLHSWPLCVPVAS